MLTFILLAHHLIPCCRYLSHSVSTLTLVEARCYDCRHLKVHVQDVMGQISADGQ